ncbi:hypothetical protein E2C01_090880 [Portunus trituberculatus]|uniref:Uncharacterized protein n=1 Tax=Portunus trituberculatus TaxID=210409 RepID=A0A5B7JFY3_PORTR|nr:hypothetical protein [Portunus trituberculatus]
MSCEEMTVMLDNWEDIPVPITLLTPLPPHLTTHVRRTTSITPHHFQQRFPSTLSTTPLLFALVGNSFRFFPPPFLPSSFI